MGANFRACRAEDLDGVYKSVATELHAFYSLAYTAKDARNDGRWRRIAIKVNRAGVRARPGAAFTPDDQELSMIHHQVPENL